MLFLLPGAHLLVHVVEELSLPVLHFSKEVGSVGGRVDQMPVPMVSIDSNIFTEIGKVVFRVKNVTRLLDFNNLWKRKKKSWHFPIKYMFIKLCSKNLPFAIVSVILNFLWFKHYCIFYYVEFKYVWFHHTEIQKHQNRKD